MLLNKKDGTKCTASETEHPGREVKLYVSVTADGIDSLASSRIGAEGFKFGGLCMQGQPDGYSVRNIFQGLCTEEGKGALKYIVGGVAE